MIIILKNASKFIQGKLEILFLSLLILITIVSTTFYNNHKVKIYKNYTDVINNIFFKKTFNHIFDNLTPRYRNINHKIAKGETFDKILNSYSIKVMKL